MTINKNHMQMALLKSLNCEIQVDDLYSAETGREGYFPEENNRKQLISAYLPSPILRNGCNF